MTIDRDSLFYLIPRRIRFIRQIELEMSRIKLKLVETSFWESATEKAEKLYKLGHIVTHWHVDIKVDMVF